MNVEATSLIVVAVFIVTFLGMAYGLKTRQGSGINEHPGPDSQDPSGGADDTGPEGPSETSGEDNSVLDQHGKK